MSESGKAVFLSYASQDAEAARRICEALRAAGVEVWFDQSELVGGDQWDGKIRGQIGSCALFVPLISANTQARLEGYFRLEWKLAAQRTHTMADEKTFLLPILIDGTRDAEAKVPAEFKSVQWTKLPGGETPPAFCVRVKKLLEGDGGSSSRETGSGMASRELGPPRKSMATKWWWALPIFGVTMALLLVLKEGRKDPAPAVAPPVAIAPSAPHSEAQELTRKARALIDDDLMAVRENFRLADEFSQRAVVLDATDGEAWATAARVSTLILRDKYEMTPERRETAKTQVERAGRLAPDSIETGLALATYLEVNKDPQEAEQTFRRLIQRAPADKRLWRGLAANLISDGRHADAVAVLQQPAGLLEQDPRAQSLLAAALAGVGRYREEQAVLDRVLQSSPAKMTYYYQLVLLGFYRSDLAAASRFLEKIPPQLMQEDGMINSAAEIWLRLGEGDKALKVLQKSPRDFLEEGFEVRPKGFLTGAALQLAGRPTAATAEWRQALVVVEKRLAGNPNQPLLLYWQAVLQALTGQKTAALETRKLYRELEARPDAWFDAILLVAVGENEQAIQGLEQAWPTARVGMRSEIRSELLYGPWLTAIRADPRMQRLIAEQSAAIERDQAGPAAAPAKADLSAVGPTKVEEKSVAVLAFANLSDDKGNEYFSDGISEELLNVLAKIPDLKVTARTSSFHFKGTNTAIPEIAQQLGVAYVIEGSVRKQGNQVRITAQLIKAADGFHVWSDTFTRDLKDIFAVQDEIAGLIAKNLELKMGMKAAARVVNPEAYALYLQGRAVMNRGMPAEYPKAIQCFKDSLGLDGDSAPTWAWLATVYNFAGAQGILGVDEGFALSREAAIRAIALDPDLAQGQVALGLYELVYAWDWTRATGAVQRAAALAPGDASILSAQALLAQTLGQTERAVQLARKAVALDPLNFISAYTLAKNCFFAGRFEEMEQQAEQMIVLNPEGRYGHIFRTFARLQLNRIDDAAQAAEQVPPSMFRLMGLALVRHAQGRAAEASQVFDELKAGFSEGAAYQIAEVSAFRHETDQAFEWLDRAQRQRDSGMTWVLNDPFLKNLHADGRWPALLKKMNLASAQLK